MNLLFPPMSDPLRAARIKNTFLQKKTDTFVSHLCIKLEITKSSEVCDECNVDLDVQLVRIIPLLSRRKYRVSTNPVKWTRFFC